MLEIVSEISAIVDTLSGSIQKEYWENVNLWGLTPDNVLYVIERLRSVNKYADIFRLIHQNLIKTKISGPLWLDILIEVFDKGQLEVLFQESYYIAEILKCINVPEDSVAKGKLLVIELMMFDHLRHHMSAAEFHLLYLVNNEPEMMMELVRLAYLPDEGYEENQEFSDTKRPNRIAVARLAWNFFYHYHGVPGTQSDRSIDGAFLKDYLTKLQKCAEQCHRVHVMPLVIGRILGNIPETDSPRLAKVFENEIKSYEHLASKEDERGKLAVLNF